MDTNEFATAVKKKYPQYAQVPNDVLTQKVVQKYPQYKSAITASQPPTAGIGGVMSAPPPQIPGMQAAPQGQPPMAPPQQAPQQQGQPQQQQIPVALQALAYYLYPDLLKQKLSGIVMGPQGIDPLKQSEINLNNEKIKHMEQPGNMKPVGKIYRNSTTGEMTDNPTVAQGPDWKEYNTTQGDALNKLSAQTSGAARNKAIETRSEAFNRGIDVKQIDELAKRTGITPKQQSVLQQNSMKAFRTIPMLQKPNLTYQELGLAETDLAGIMQGGVPQTDQLHNVKFPGWQEDFARVKTYATGHPSEVVPPEIRKKVLSMITGMIQIDNQFLRANQKFSQSMLGPTVRGGIKQFDKPIQSMTDTLTGVNAGGGDMSSMSDDQLRKIAAGGQ
jgi:hypothetical protein